MLMMTVKRKLAERGFIRDEKGSILVFVLVVFSAMFLVGGTAVDLARHETLRASLQYNLDRAVLAAASLKQTQDPNVVVQDYMSKIKTIENFSLVVNSTIATNARTVSATATSNLDTWFLSMAGIDSMPITTSSSASEKIPNLEISLVLDVSGSMGNNSKMTNLKVAAKDFVTNLLANTENDTVAFSIVPFNHNVTPSIQLYDALNVTQTHSYSTCLDFADSDFSSVKIDPTVSQTQGMYTSLYGGWQNISGWSKTCYPYDYSEILPYSDNVTTLHAKIDSLQPDGNTAGHLGMKWGLALLDPSFQPVVNTLIAGTVVDPGFAGIPAAYSNAKTMKIVIFMGDGANTVEMRAGSNYSGPASDLYTVSYVSQTFDYAYRKNKVWKKSNKQSKCSSSKWVCVYSEKAQTDYYLKKQSDNKYYDIESNTWISASTFNNLPNTLNGWTSTKQLNWGEAWGQMAIDWYDNKVNKDAFNDFYYSTGRNGSEADTVMAASCQAAEDAGIVVYTIGFETNYTTSQKLKACATTDSHYYDASGTEISTVFAAIASSIQKLKLISIN